MPGELDLWSTVLLARQSAMAPVANRLRPLTRRVRRIVGRTNGRRTVRLLAQGGALLGVVAGTVAFASYDKSVTLTVDDHTSSVHAFGSDVGDILSSKGISVGPHDLVSPSPSSRVHDGEHVVVRYGRQLTVTSTASGTPTGPPRSPCSRRWPSSACATDGAALSVSRDEPLGRAGLSMSVTTPKEVTVAVDGRQIQRGHHRGQRGRPAQPAGHHARPAGHRVGPDSARR